MFLEGPNKISDKRLHFYLYRLYNHTFTLLLFSFTSPPKLTVSQIFELRHLLVFLDYYMDPMLSVFSHLSFKSSYSNHVLQFELAHMVSVTGIILFIVCLHGFHKRWFSGQRFDFRLKTPKHTLFTVNLKV